MKNHVLHAFLTLTYNLPLPLLSVTSTTRSTYLNLIKKFPIYSITHIFSHTNSVLHSLVNTSFALHLYFVFLILRRTLSLRSMCHRLYYHFFIKLLFRDIFIALYPHLIYRPLATRHRYRNNVLNTWKKPTTYMIF